jgi:TonB-linked SusC/RagA family outer membrane protein
MHAVLRSTLLGVLLGAASLAFEPATPAAAQQFLMAGRAPRFLAPASPRGAPVEVDVSAVPALTERVSIRLDAPTVGDALEAITAQTGIRFAYSPDVLPLSRRLGLRAENITVAAALLEILIDTGVDVVLSSDNRLALVARVEGAQPEVGMIIGTVTDSATGDALPGATVSAEGAPRSVTTNEQGRYRITDVPAGRRKITVRLIGYEPAQRVVEVMEDEGVVADFVLRGAITRLQEIVSTATGDRRRYELGNAIATINADSIVRTQPIRTVSELLETRVPGLTVAHTSGAPGDPTRLRLRGLNSVTRSNDPIVIVDGVRIYADQSDARAANLAGLDYNSGKPFTGTSQIATRSPVDQIDPHSVDRIEVFKGPSAATLYGADAANGVIVITTKRGQPGATRWTFGTDYATSHMPGEYPDAYIRFGHNEDSGKPGRCALVAFNCVVDSLVRFQVLNDPELTVLGRGNRKSLNLGVSGGSSSITYSLTGSYADETGLLKLPDYEDRRYRNLVGEAPTDWMRRPHQLNDWNATGHVNVQLGSSADFSFTSSVDRSSQHRSSLDQRLGDLMAVYADTINNRYYSGTAVNTGPGETPGGLLEIRGTLATDFFTRTTADATSFTEAARVNWRPLGWLTTNVDLGLNVIDRRDESSQARRDINDPYFDQFALGAYEGFFNVGTGSSTVTTANVGGIALAPLMWGLKLRTAIGANYTRTRTNDILAAGLRLIPGATGIEGAQQIVTTPQRSGVTSFGWYVEPTIEHKRFYLSGGLRLDGADTYGSDQELAAFPKVSLSYLVSDEPFFPLKNVFNTLRLRAAYGQAGVQPGSADRLRLYAIGPGYLDGSFTDATEITTLGNAQLKPERSAEFEGGLDADLFGNRLTLEVTAYRKTRLDALVPVTFPPSINGGGTQLVNIGRVRNTGFEIALGTNLFRGDAVAVSTQFHVSRNRNRVLDTGDAGEIEGPGGTRVVEGYPLFGRWARPIQHYADVNGDGIIEHAEVQLGDDQVFLGSPEPDYEAALYANISLARGLVTVSGGLSYTDGQLQVNEAVRETAYTVRAVNDPSAPLSEQAAAVVREQTPYGLAQVLSTLRFHSLSVAVNAPERIAGMFGARTLSFTAQGTNLGLWTNYRGHDPNVNAYSTGNVIADTGQLPLPRTWSFGIRLGI